MLVKACWFSVSTSSLESTLQMWTRASESWPLCRKWSQSHNGSKHSVQQHGCMCYALRNVTQTKRELKMLYSQDHDGFGEGGGGRGKRGGWLYDEVWLCVLVVWCMLCTYYQYYIVWLCVLVVWCMYYVMHKLPILHLYCLTVCVSCVMYVLCHAQITDTILFDCVC